MIKFTRNCHYDNCYSEWMRIGNGQIAAVSCMAREKENAALYAYAYTHAIMTLFRQSYSGNNIIKNKKELAELILEYCKYAEQKLDVALESKETHPVPYISGILTLSNGEVIAFTVGNACVRIAYQDEKKEVILKPPSIFSGHIKNGSFSSKRLPVHTVKIYPINKTSFDLITLTPDEKDFTNGCLLVIENKENLDNTAPFIYRAVVTGRRHVSKGQYCQDYADFKLIENGTVAAALSDGAGGGNCSEYGARMNVENFLSCCEDDIPYEQFGSDLLQRIKDAHEELQIGKPVDGIQAYATLMGVFVKDGMVMWYHIGDGAIYGRKYDGTVECISDAENYQVSNRTYFTIEADAADHLYKGKFEKEEYEKIIIMTDGVYNGYSEEEQDYDQEDRPEEEHDNRRMDFIQQIFSESDEESFDDVKLAELIDSEEVLRYGDDHSAIMIDFGKREE